MALTEDDYLAHLLGLLPSGPAWPRDSGAVTTRMLDGLAAELARVDARVDNLLDEADPRTTTELLENWERLFGLPDPCLRQTKQLIPGYYDLLPREIASFSRTSIATYFDATGTLQAAPANAPRFDHDPLTSQPRGLLIEVARTNLLQRSKDFNLPPWVANRAVLTASAGPGPDGQLSATKYAADTTLGNHGLSQTVTAQASTQYVLSTFAKAGEYKALRLRASDSVGFLIDAVVDLSSGTIRNPSPYSKVVPVGDGWYRISLICTTSATATNVSHGLWVYDNEFNPTFAGDGASGLYIFGAGLEQGSFETSYIPTGAATVTRAADIAVVDVDPTIAERRGRLLQRIAFQGGQSIAFFTGLLNAMGYSGVTVTEFRPFRANSKCNASLNQGGWRYAWRVNVPASADVRRMKANSRCNEALATWGDPGLYCLLAQYKPAHTILYIGYGDT